VATGLHELRRRKGKVCSWQSTFPSSSHWRPDLGHFHVHRHRYGCSRRVCGRILIYLLSSSLCVKGVAFPKKCMIAGHAMACDIWKVAQ
jgi:hypothetical protein